MASSEEPPTKKLATKVSFDFKLCLLCQGEKFTSIKGVNQLENLSQPESESYQSLINCINERAKYQNPEFICLQKQLRSISVDELNIQYAVWHRSCYGRATHKQHIERDKARYERAILSQQTSVLTYNNVRGRPPTSKISKTQSQENNAPISTFTRSQFPQFLKERCFYCQNQKFLHYKIEPPINCQSADAGKSIKDIVDASGNEQWKFHLASIITDGDLLPKDIKYHKSCHTSNWRRYIQSKERVSHLDLSAKVENTVEFIAAEIEFSAKLQESLDQGNTLTLSEVATMYNNMMCSYGIENQFISRAVLLDKIDQQIKKFSITEAKGRKPAVIHSKKFARAAIDTALEETDAEAIQQDMRAIFNCSKIIRQSILQSRTSNPWSFKGSLIDYDKQCIPKTLVTMIRWIIQGPQEATTETHAKELDRTCQILSHSIVQACKSKRQMSLLPRRAASEFRDTFESPYSIGLSLYVYHSFRSKKAIMLLNNGAFGITYDRVQKICTNIASSVCKNITKFGVYIPPGLLKNKTIRASIDNIDKNVDTPDGKNTFHGIAIGVYQSSGEGEAIINHLDPNKETPVSEILKNVPQTVIQLLPCVFKGSPKPKISPQYASYKIGSYDEQFNASQVNDLVWMIARHGNRTIQFKSPNFNEICPEVSDMPGKTQPNISTDTTIETERSILDQGVDKQQVHLWGAYNSLVCTPDNKDKLPVIDKTFSLPIINAAATEWPTLITALDQLTKLNTVVSESKNLVVVTLDMDLYKRVLKLEYLDSNFKNKWVFCPGAFHTAICALRCLGRTIEGSGLDDAWQEADLYSSVIVSQILNGNHYNRAIEAHQMTLQALFDLWFEEFLEDHPIVRDTLIVKVKQLTEACKLKKGIVKAHQALLMEIESLNLEKQLQDFDKLHENNPMYKWARMYMRQVTTLLQFQRSVRDGNWHLYLASLEHLCKYFFAYSRLDYAQNIPEFIARMDAMKTSHPDLWQDFTNGEFTVNTSNHIPFTRIGIDQAMEHLNKSTKGQGGISGITNSPATLLKFCLTAPELARIATELEDLVGTARPTTLQQHHQISQSKIARQEHSIAQLKAVLSSCNLFKKAIISHENTNVEGSMYKLMSKEVIPCEIQKSILATEENGMKAFQIFVRDRIIGSQNLWDKMTKVKQKSWTTAAKDIVLDIDSQVVTLKATASLFARLLVIARSSRESINLEEVIGKYEFAHTNKILMAPDGSIHPTTDKGIVIKLLEEMVASETVQTSPKHIKPQDKSEMSLIVDGMGVVQELMAVKNFQTCKDLATSFITVIDSRAQSYDQVRVIFDNYTKEASLKEQTRERRRGNIRGIKSYIAQDSTKIKDKKMFLASHNTKNSLTLYLSDQLILYSKAKVVTVTWQKVLANHECGEISGTSTQEEADTLMIYHAVEVVSKGMEVHIYSQDTDVLLLALRRTPLLGKQPAIIMGTGEGRRKVLLWPIYRKLGPEKSAALINWHALTGCDTTGHIKGKGKRGCFKAFLKASPTVLKALTNLGKGVEPSQEVLDGCEEFLCSLFCPSGVYFKQANMLRWHLFKQLKEDQGVDKLPPTQGAWTEHIRRAHIQANIWHQDITLNPTCLDPLTLGWQNLDKKPQVVLSRVAPAPVSLLQLVKCNCDKSKCSKRCSCRQNNVVCTELCKCGGEDESCTNTTPTIIGEDLSD